MEIEKIKEANKKVLQLEKLQEKIKELDKSEHVDGVSISRNFMSKEYAYDVRVTGDQEFLQTIKSLIRDKLLRDEKKLIDEINSI